MSKRMKIAFGCHLLAFLILAGFGFTYLFRSEFMPYHAVALGMPWSEVTPPFQAVIIALMRAVGAACLALVVLELFVLVVPFRRGVVWARWAIPAGGLVISGGALYAMLHLALNTPATPPWMGPAAGGLLVCAGLVLSLGQANSVVIGAPSHSSS